jgi:hypothetical protein
MADEEFEAAEQEEQAAEAPSEETREEAEEKGKLNLKGDTSGQVQAPSHPEFTAGDNLNSDDARKAYERAGSSFEEQQRLGAEGEPPGSN